MARFRMVEIDENFFRQLEEFKRDNIRSIAATRFAIDKIMMGYALTAKAFAQKKSAGPVTTNDHVISGTRLVRRGGMVGLNPGGGRAVATARGVMYRQSTTSPAAWKIPVRRITGEYFSGWRVERLSHAVWILTNDSREAYYIEFGINHVSTTGLYGPSGQRVRIRRPILKMSANEAIRAIAALNLDSKVIVELFRQRPGGGGTQSYFERFPK